QVGVTQVVGAPPVAQRGVRDAADNLRRQVPVVLTREHEAAVVAGTVVPAVAVAAGLAALLLGAQRLKQPSGGGDDADTLALSADAQVVAGQLVPAKGGDLCAAQPGVVAEQQDQLVALAGSGERIRDDVVG